MRPRWAAPAALASAVGVDRLAACLGSTRWPSFRGVLASGVGDGAQLPTEWDLAAGTNIKWRTPLPGLAHSSPIVWDDLVFVTTAVSTDPNATFRKGPVRRR